MFTEKTDWTTNRVKHWKPLIDLCDIGVHHGLEIGTYEGRTAKWFMDKVLTHERSTLTCIDPYAYSGRKELRDHQLEKAKEISQQALEPYGERVIRHYQESQKVLITLQRMYYSFVYVDGQHTLQGCLTDMVLSWPLIKPGGIMMVDDVNPAQTKKRIAWRDDSPWKAVEAFLEMYPQIEVLWHRNTVGLQKP